MRIFLAVAAIAATVVAAGFASTSGRPVALTITYWADEHSTASPDRWTLRCNPLGGTLPDRKRACVKLSTLTVGAFAQVPMHMICTQIYGGPQKAVVKGTIGSQRIWSSFRRRDGCEISRWARFAPWLLPPSGVNQISLP